MTVTATLRVDSGVARTALAPEVSQRVFRVVLDALARPGQLGQLPAQPGVAPVLLPLLALADLDTAACVLTGSDSGTGWADLVTLATSAPAVPVDRARLVAALRPIRPDELRALPRGTALAPEDGALVTLAVATELWSAPTARTTRATRFRLAGPGIPGRRETLLPMSAELLTARAEAVAGYPAGIDLLLVDPAGRVLGLPRTTTIEER